MICFLAVPRIVVIGPPASGRGTISGMICKALGTDHVTLDSVLKKGSSIIVSEIKEYCSNDVPVPLDTWAHLVQSRLVYYCPYYLLVLLN